MCFVISTEYLFVKIGVELSISLSDLEDNAVVVRSQEELTDLSDHLHIPNAL